MLCPNCKKELIIVEREQIELDYCMDCKGFWFDNNEWNLLCESLYLNGGESFGDIYSIPKLIIKEKTKKCPVCGKNMEKFMVYDTVLDRCPMKHGMWFDANEMSKVLGRNNSKNKRLTPLHFLGEVFYKD